jgi:hypothetical protein
MPSLNLRKALLVKLALEEATYFRPNKAQLAQLKSIKKHLKLYNLNNIAHVTPNKRVLTPVSGKKKSPNKTFNLSVPHKVKKGRFVIATR